VRVHRSTDFQRRAALYSQLDGQLCEHTRFFAAAALVNDVLALFFEALPLFRFPRSFEFLSVIGADLETQNLTYAREIEQGLGRSTLDQTLVCAEQARLQRYVQQHEVRGPRQWEGIRRELNGMLNERYASRLFCGWGESAARIYRVLNEVRGHLGTRLDFAVETHRVRIGLGLIEQIRRENES
jgi:GNAT superfamily N-acetyltransferase